MAYDWNRLLRPREWKDVVGQKSAVALARESLLTHRFPKLSLFSGPAGVGKSLIAELIAMALTCDSGTDTPCLQCKSCKSFLEDKTYNIYKYNMAKLADKKDAINVVEDIFKWESINGKAVYILEEIHALKPTQQEPFLEELTRIPEDINIIMCTTQPYRLSRELRSRALPFMLETPTTTECVDFVSSIGRKMEITLPPRNILVKFVNLCENNPRNIVKYLEVMSTSGEVKPSMIQEIFKTVDNSLYIDMLKNLNSSVTMSEYTRFLVNAKQDNGTQFVYIMRGLRDFLVNAYVEASTGTQEPTLSSNERKELGEIFKRIGESGFLKLMEAMSQAPNDALNSETAAQFYLMMLKGKIQGKPDGAVLADNKKESYNEKLQSAGLARARSNVAAPTAKFNKSSSANVTDADIANTVGVTSVFTE